MYVCPTCNTPFPGYSYVSYKFSASLRLTFSYTKYPLDKQEVCLPALLPPLMVFCNASWL